MGTMESMETDGDDAMETACCEESVLRLLSFAAQANQEDHVRKLEHVGTIWRFPYMVNIWLIMANIWLIYG